MAGVAGGAFAGVPSRQKLGSAATSRLSASYDVIFVGGCREGADRGAARGVRGGGERGFRGTGIHAVRLQISQQAGPLGEGVANPTLPREVRLGVVGGGAEDERATGGGVRGERERRAAREADEGTTVGRDRGHLQEPRATEERARAAETRGAEPESESETSGSNARAKSSSRRSPGANADGGASSGAARAGVAREGLGHRPPTRRECRRWEETG